MKARDIRVDWRVSKRFSHDRYLLSKGLCLNVPPVGTIYSGDYSELLQTDSQPPWEECWEGGTPLLDYPLPNAA